MDIKDYYTAKIYGLSGQPKFRGSGAKREYNSYYDYARVELLYFLDQLASIPNSRKHAVIIAKKFRKMMRDEEEVKKMWLVCPISKRQAYVMAEIAVEYDIDFLSYPEIMEEQEEEY